MIQESKGRAMRWAVLFMLGAVLAGCATTTERFEVVRLPERAADVYPNAHIQDSVAVAAEAIARDRRTRLYFGAPLAGEGILPVRVLVTNHSDRRLRLTPEDVLLAHRGRALDPLPVELVARAIERVHGEDAVKAGQEIRRYLGEVALGDTVVSPGKTGGGVVFFQLAEEAGSGYDQVAVLGGSGAEPLELTVQLSGAGQGQRRRFGPFYLGD
jgi:hypothetical protein